MKPHIGLITHGMETMPKRIDCIDGVTWRSSFRRYCSASDDIDWLPSITAAMARIR